MREACTVSKYPIEDSLTNTRSGNLPNNKLNAQLEFNLFIHNCEYMKYIYLKLLLFSLSFTIDLSNGAPGWACWKVDIAAPCPCRVSVPDPSYIIMKFKVALFGHSYVRYLKSLSENTIHLSHGVEFSHRLFLGTRCQIFYFY